MTDTLVNALAISGTNLFVGSEGGVFLSTNNGTSWTEANAGFTNPALRSLAVSSTHLFAGAVGVWRRPLSEMITAAEPVTDELPKTYLLGQNYPNPFNPSTTIKYELPQQAHVVLTVFNMLGQEVATLLDEVVDAGYHESQFDASDLASGVYLYRLQAGDFMHTRKLVVLK